MFIVRFSLAVVIVLFIYVMFSQIIIPLWNDKPLFPIFRKQPPKEEPENQDSLLLAAEELHRKKIAKLQTRTRTQNE